MSYYTLLDILNSLELELSLIVFWCEEQQQTSNGKHELSPRMYYVSTPKHPRYAVPAVRISSFDNWPVYVEQTPQSLAVTGLFYLGFGDNVKCFFCGGGLRNWEPQDIPWVEHARWYPQCAFLIQCQGLEFVRKVQHQSSGPNVSETVCCSNILKRTSNIKLMRSRISKTFWFLTNLTVLLNNSQRSPATADFSETAEGVISDIDNSHPMTSVAAQSAIEMGYTEVTVKDAVRQLTQQTGSSDFCAVELVSLIMENEEKENHSSSPATTKCETEDNKSVYTNNNRTTRGHSPTGNNENIRSLIEENRQMREESLCRICLEDSSCIVFLPCGHRTTCPRCAQAFRKCPVCRKAIQGTVKTYLS
ncbi:hypothetical protein ScPMuIL_004396 [Solemya velum]